MNNYVRKIASEYNIPINKITIKNNTRIIDDKIVLKKKKNNDLNNVYKYLKSRSFDYFPEPITIDNLYEVYPFLEDTYEPSEQKATDIIIYFFIPLFKIMLSIINTTKNNINISSNQISRW